MPVLANVSRSTRTAVVAHADVRHRRNGRIFFIGNPASTNPGCGLVITAGD